MAAAATMPVPPAFAPCMMAMWSQAPLTNQQTQPQQQQLSAASNSTFAAAPLPAMGASLEAQQWHDARLQRLLADVARLHGHLAHLKHEVLSVAAPAGAAADNFGCCVSDAAADLQMTDADDDACSSCGDASSDDEYAAEDVFAAQQQRRPAAAARWTLPPASGAVPQHPPQHAADSDIAEMLQDALAAAIHKAAGASASADSADTGAMRAGSPVAAGSSGRWVSDHLHLEAAMQAELHDCLLQSQMLRGMA